MATLAEACVGVLAPSCCTLCGEGLVWGTGRAGVCGACWENLPRRHPGCPTCGDPGAGDAQPCRGCREHPPPWDGFTFIGPYLGPLRELVLQLKHQQRDELAEPLAARLAAAAGQAGWPRPDALVPAPMWWLRRLHRGFNQAELLARRTSRHMGVALGDCLRRSRGRTQVGRPRQERLRLAADEIRARRPVPQRVVLVDDVVTTGATARACCRALRAAGAREVYLLAVARTPRFWRSS